jgi:hypothetical protein
LTSSGIVPEQAQLGIGEKWKSTITLFRIKWFSGRLCLG